MKLNTITRCNTWFVPTNHCKFGIFICESIWWPFILQSIWEKKINKLASHYWYSIRRNHLKFECSTSVGRITSPHIIYDTKMAAIETKIDRAHNVHNIFRLRSFPLTSPTMIDYLFCWLIYLLFRFLFNETFAGRLKRTLMWCDHFYKPIVDYVKLQLKLVRTKWATIKSTESPTMSWWQPASHRLCFSCFFSVITHSAKAELAAIVYGYNVVAKYPTCHVSVRWKYNLNMKWIFIVGNLIVNLSVK